MGATPVKSLNSRHPSSGERGGGWPSRRRALGQGGDGGPSSVVECRGGGSPVVLPDTRGSRGGLAARRCDCGGLEVEEATVRRRGRRLVGLGGLGGGAAARRRGRRASWKTQWPCREVEDGTRSKSTGPHRRVPSRSPIDAARAGAATGRADAAGAPGAFIRGAPTQVRVPGRLQR